MQQIHRCLAVLFNGPMEKNNGKRFVNSKPYYFEPMKKRSVPKTAVDGFSDRSDTKTLVSW